MQLADFLENITPEQYQNLKQSIELGRWPNGERMTPEQRDLSLQALIAYEHKHLPESERVGYMPQTCKSAAATEETILRFKDR